MSDLPDLTEIDETDDVAPAPGGLGGIRTLALGLWVLVGSLLVYGISQTAIKAAALFG